MSEYELRQLARQLLVESVRRDGLPAADEFQNARVEQAQGLAQKFLAVLDARVAGLRADGVLKKP